MSKSTLAQKLFLHGGVYAFSRLLNQGVGFLLLPILARYLGPEGYGVFSLATTTAGIASIVLLQGVPGAWFRLRFARSEQDRLESDSVALWYISASLITGIGLACLIGEPLTRHWLPGVPFYPILLLALFVEACVELVSVFQRKHQAEQRPVAFLWISVLRNLASLTLALVFVVGFARGVQGRLEGELLAVGCLTVWLFVGFRPRAPWRLSWSHLKPLLSYGLPLVPHQLAGVVNQAIDRPLVNHFVGLAEAGLYAMSYKVASVGFVVSSALNQALTTLVYETLTDYESLPEAERTRRAGEVRKSGLYLTSAAAACLLGIAAVGRETLLFVASARFETAWRLMPVLCAGMLVLSIYQPLANMMIFFNRVRWLPVATIGAAIVNVGLNWWLLPITGIMGAAWATLVSNLVLLAIAARLTAPLFRVYDWTKVGAVVILTGVGLGTFYTCDASMSSLGLRLAAKLATLGVVVLGLQTVTGVSLRDLRTLLRQRSRKGQEQ